MVINFLRIDIYTTITSKNVWPIAVKWKQNKNYTRLTIPKTWEHVIYIENRKLCNLHDKRLNFLWKPQKGCNTDLRHIGSSFLGNNTRNEVSCNYIVSYAWYSWLLYKCNLKLASNDQWKSFKNLWNVVLMQSRTGTY